MGAPISGSNKIVITRLSNTDLTAYVNRGVKIVNDTQCGLPNSAATYFGGVLENISGSGSSAVCRICMFGETKMVAGAALSAGISFAFGDSTANTATGAAIAVSSAPGYASAPTANTVTQTWTNGFTLQTSAANSEVVSVFIQNNSQYWSNV